MKHKVFCNYSGTLSEIAKTVSADKHLYNWINHKKESHNQCPVTNEELNRILDLMRLYSFEQKSELQKFLIQPAELWEPEKFSTFCEEKSKIIKEEMKYIPPIKQMVISYGLFLFIIFISTFFVGCDSGWTIAGWEVK